MRIAQQLGVTATLCPGPETAATEGIWARTLTQINTRDRDEHSPNKPEARIQAFAARLRSLASLCSSGEQRLEEEPWLAYAGASGQLPPPAPCAGAARTAESRTGGSIPGMDPLRQAAAATWQEEPRDRHWDGTTSTGSEQYAESLAGESLLAIRLNAISAFRGLGTKETARCALERAWVRSVSARHDVKCPSKPKESHLRGPDPCAAHRAPTAPLSPARALQRRRRPGAPHTGKRAPTLESHAY